VPTHLDPFETTNKSNLILFTGGYDDYFRVFSPRGKPEVLAELRIGHGVYKLKFLQDLGTLSADQDIKLQVLASCTNAGVRILEITGKDGGRGEWSINILASMTQHQSLCYASDVMPVYSTEKNGRRVIISTSMYDKLLCVWTFDDSIWKEEGDGISEPRRDDELIKSEVID
jgi:diphthamide biosynthesis protein 7